MTKTVVRLLLLLLSFIVRADQSWLGGSVYVSYALNFVINFVALSEHPPHLTSKHRSIGRICSINIDYCCTIYLLASSSNNLIVTFVWVSNQIASISCSYDRSPSWLASSLDLTRACTHAHTTAIERRQFRSAGL